jgi:hypothetical protein
MTLTQVKEVLRAHVKDGFICPCCNGHAKMYARPLTSAMAIGLILIYRAAKEHRDNYLHVENYLKFFHGLPASIRGDIPKLRFWGLLEPMPGETQDGNPNNGHYRVTPKGIDFVLLKITVPSHVMIYNNKSFGHPMGAKQINISEALKKKFDYLKLMKGEFL